MDKVNRMTAPTITLVDSLNKLPVTVFLRMTYTPPTEGVAYKWQPTVGLGGREPRPVYFVVVEVSECT
jgi:hypothetical protein